MDFCQVFAAQLYTSDEKDDPNSALTCPGWTEKLVKVKLNDVRQSARRLDFCHGVNMISIIYRTHCLKSALRCFLFFLLLLHFLPAAEVWILSPSSALPFRDNYIFLPPPEDSYRKLRFMDNYIQHTASNSHDIILI